MNSRSKKEKLNWQLYEAITKYIYQILGGSKGVTVEGFGSSCKVKGKSHTSYQIDVLTNHTEGENTYQTAIECKFWNKKVTREVIMKLAATLEDTGIEKGIIVSKMGFTKDGAAYAKAKNIGLVELREAGDNDFETVPQVMPLFGLGINVVTRVIGPEIIAIHIDGVEQQDWDNTIFFITTVVLSDGIQNQLWHYADSFREEIGNRTLEDPLVKDFEFPGARLVNTWSRKSVGINKITFTGAYIDRESEQRRTYDVVDKVWLVMKDLFEGKSFRFTENGILVQHS